jgi:hypothetical protein
MDRAHMGLVHGRLVVDRSPKHVLSACALLSCAQGFLLEEEDVRLGLVHFVVLPS